MAWENIITSIDIGTSKIRTLIGSFAEEKTRDFHVLGVWAANSYAIRKWNILDMEEFKSNLDSSLEEAEKMSGEQVTWVNISFNLYCWFRGRSEKSNWYVGSKTRSYRKYIFYE